MPEMSTERYLALKRAIAKGTASPQTVSLDELRLLNINPRTRRTFLEEQKLLAISKSVSDEKIRQLQISLETYQYALKLETARGEAWYGQFKDTREALENFATVIPNIIAKEEEAKYQDEKKIGKTRLPNMGDVGNIFGGIGEGVSNWVSGVSGGFTAGLAGIGIFAIILVIALFLFMFMSMR